MNCEECPFNLGTKVYGEGSRILRQYTEDVPTKDPKITFKRDVTEYDNEGQYDVVCVGMAPAVEEVRQGRPFIGASGQILRNTLVQMGISEYYLCNIFLCPITEEISIPKALGCCRDILEEVTSRNPKLIVVLGDLPLHQLCDIKLSISAVQGRVIPSKIGVPVLPLTHPAYYLRYREKDFFDFVECMRSGTKYLSGTYAQCVDPEYKLCTKDNYTDLLNELDRYDEIACDLETKGLFAYGWNPAKILEMGLAGDHKTAYIIPQEFIKEFKPILESKKLDFWNAPFDCSFLRKEGIKAYPYFDGMVGHYTIDERPYGHSLDKVARIYLGSENWKDDIKPYLNTRKEDIDDKEIDYSRIPEKIRYKYLAKDVTRTRQLKDVLLSDINEKTFWPLLMPAQRMFIDIQERGMRVNPLKMMEMRPKLESTLNKLEKEIYELTKRWINPNSPKQVAELIYDELEYPVDSYLGRTTGKAVMQQWRGDPIVEAILSYREISKMKNTYIDGFAAFVDRDFRIHPSIKVTGSETGRLSSENPSIMNIKLDKILKSMFIAEKNRVFLYYDIKGNELRWYAIIANEPVLLEDLRNGRDTHHEIGLVAFDGDDELSRKYRTGVKAGVFGTIYLRGLDSMMRQFGNKAQDVMNAINQRIPNAREYRDDTLAQMRTKGYLETPFHRKRRYPLITRDSVRGMQREGVNFRIQSPGSDTMLHNMLFLWDNRKRWDIFPFWPVHDSITMDAPDKELLLPIKKELEEYTNDLVNKVCPFIWEPDWGYDWSMTKEDTISKEDLEWINGG